MQCHTFPFWPENLKSRYRWKQLKSFCKGIDNGRLIELEEIRRLVRQQKKTDDRLRSVVFK
jgi:hypothetical protein